MSPNETPAVVGDKPPKPAPPPRLPSLTQLAARISPSTTTPTQSIARPRLATSILTRTGSSQGPSSGDPLSSTTSATDNMDATEPPTEQLANAALEDRRPEDSARAGSATSEKVPRGYKNVPSLEAITERMAMARARSAEGKDKQEGENVAEDPILVGGGVSSTASGLEEGEITEATKETDPKSPNHPLQHTWTLFHDCKNRPPMPGTGQPAHHAYSQSGEQSPYIAPPNTATGEYEAGLTTIGEFNTVEDFCRYFNWLKPPSQLERNSNYHLFKDGIKPMWEDPANADGGKWVLTMKSSPELLDRCWAWLAMALVGEELDEKDEICGAVVSLRAKVDRIQVWLRMKDDVERINQIGKRLVKLLDVENEPAIGLEFQYNTDDRPSHTKFISIVSADQRGSFIRGPRGGPVPEGGDSQSSAGPSTTFSGFGGGGMGSFSTGQGSGWRSGGSRIGGGIGKGAGTGVGGGFGGQPGQGPGHSRAGSQSEQRGPSGGTGGAS